MMRRILDLTKNHVAKLKYYYAFFPPTGLASKRSRLSNLESTPMRPLGYFFTLQSSRLRH